MLEHVDRGANFQLEFVQGKCFFFDLDMTENFKTIYSAAF